MPTDVLKTGVEEGHVLTDEFEQLVGRYHVDLMRLALVMSGDRALAEDAVQSAWQAAWRSRGDIRDPTRIAAWLRTVTANEVRRQLRRQRLRTLLHGRLRPPEPIPPADPRHLDLVRVLTGLDTSDRQLLALRFGLGLTSAEIGEQLGIGASAARVRLHRLLVRLRTELGDD